MRRSLPTSIAVGAAAVMLLSAPVMAAELPWHAQDSGTGNILKGVKFASDACHAWAVGEPPDAIPTPFANAPAGYPPDGPTPILYTKDAGLHWKKQNSGLRDITLNRVDFVDLKHGWAVGEPPENPTTAGGSTNGGAVLHTTNGGKTWVAQTANLPVNDSDMEGLSFVNKNRGWIAASDDQGTDDGGHIYFTNNAGATWVSQTLPSTTDVADVYFLDKWNGWAINDDGDVMHTTNGGADGIGGWEIQASLERGFPEAIDFWNLKRGVVVGEEGTLMYTRDGGETWHQSTISNNTGGRFNNINFTDVSFGRKGLVGVSAEMLSEEGHRSWVLISHNGGKTFKALTSHVGANLNSISFAHGTDDALASGAQGAMVSNEGDPTGDCV